MGDRKKLVEGISENVDVDLFDVKEVAKKDFSTYRAIGFASGIYMSKIHKTLFSFLDGASVLPNKTFIVYTSGSGIASHPNKLDINTATLFVRKIANEGL